MQSSTTFSSGSTFSSWAWPFSTFGRYWSSRGDIRPDPCCSSTSSLFCPSLSDWYTSLSNSYHPTGYSTWKITIWRQSWVLAWCNVGWSLRSRFAYGRYTNRNTMRYQRILKQLKDGSNVASSLRSHFHLSYFWGLQSPISSLKLNGLQMRTFSFQWLPFVI